MPRESVRPKTEHLVGPSVHLRHINEMCDEFGFLPKEAASFLKLLGVTTIKLPTGVFYPIFGFELALFALLLPGGKGWETPLVSVYGQDFVEPAALLLDYHEVLREKPMEMHLLMMLAGLLYQNVDSEVVRDRVYACGDLLIKSLRTDSRKRVAEEKEASGLGRNPRPRTL